jgi:hypothetical protein
VAVFTLSAGVLALFAGVGIHRSEKRHRRRSLVRLADLRELLDEPKLKGPLERERVESEEIPGITMTLDDWDARADARAVGKSLASSLLIAKRVEFEPIAPRWRSITDQGRRPESGGVAKDEDLLARDRHAALRDVLLSSMDDLPLETALLDSTTRGVLEEVLDRLPPRSDDQERGTSESSG